VAALADKGVSRAHLIAMEKGESDPSLSMLFKLATLLGIPFMALAREIATVVDPPASITTQEAVQDATMVAGGILVIIPPRGQLNSVLAMPFFAQIFEEALARGTVKILLNVTELQMDISVVERHQLADDIAAWLKDRSFAPSMAVVTLPSSGVGPGAEMVRRQGMNVRVFASPREALEWLRS
jgi:DNA-binding XRE family transcriptional regulator